jgi:hypothetical protein
VNNSVNQPPPGPPSAGARPYSAAGGRVLEGTQPAPLLVLARFGTINQLTKNKSHWVTPFWHNDTRPRVTVTFGARRPSRLRRFGALPAQTTRPVTLPSGEAPVSYRISDGVFPMWVDPHGSHTGTYPYPNLSHTGLASIPLGLQASRCVILRRLGRANREPKRRLMALAAARSACPRAGSNSLVAPQAGGADHSGREGARP